MAGRRCKTCHHPDRAEIEQMRFAGATYRQIKTKFPEFSIDNLALHFKKHVTDELANALKSGGYDNPAIDLKALHQQEAESVLANIIYQRKKQYMLLERAEEENDLKAATAIHTRIHQNLQLTAKIVGELQTQINVNHVALVAHPDYARLRDSLIQALTDHPAAARAITAALRNVETTGGAEVPVLRTIEHDDA